MSSIDARINQTAALTSGAVRIGELVRSGVSYDAIRRRVKDGTLVRWHSDVLLVGAVAAEPSVTTRLHAAVLAGHEDAVLSHSAAVAHLGAWNRWDGHVHVTSPSVRSKPGPPSVTFHRTRSVLPAEAIRVIDGIPTMAGSWACALLGTKLTRFQITNVMRELEFLGAFDGESFRDVLRDLGRPRGATTVRGALTLFDGHSAGTKSRSEDRLLGGILRAGGIEPLVNVRGATGLRGVELDFVWPTHRLVVEADGGQHAFGHARTNDADVDEALRELGWLVVRIPTQWIWSDLPGCVATVLETLERRNRRIARSRPMIEFRPGEQHTAAR